MSADVADVGLPGEAVVAAAIERGARISLQGRARTRGNAGEAMLSTKSTIGDDDRTQADASKYPFRAVLRVESRFGHREQGTAFLAGPRTLVTAGHCVFNPEQNRMASEVAVFDDSGQSLAVHSFGCHRAWAERHDDQADIAYIRLMQPLGEARGYLGTAAVGARQLSGDFAVSGYPTDLDDGRRQYFHIGKILQHRQRLFGYQIDTGGGQSGAPLFYMADGIATAVGIHTQGAGTHGNFNLGLRITPALVEWIRGWVAQR